MPVRLVMANTKCEVAVAAWTGDTQDDDQERHVDYASADAEKTGDHADQKTDDDPEPHVRRSKYLQAFAGYVGAPLPHRR